MGKNLNGIFPPITTPFDEGGRLLTDRLRDNLDRWSEIGLAGFTVLGSNGECAYLSDGEMIEVATAARSRIPAARTMIVGAGRESTHLCIDFTKKIADLGGDYALVGTPCYYKAKMSDEVLFRHFAMVADHSPIPILVYNVPQFTGVNTSAALILRLSSHENVAGIKDSSANLQLQSEIRRCAPPRFRILVGSAPTLLASLMYGACGGIVAVACALPEWTVELYEAFHAGDWKQCSLLQSRLSPPAAAVTTTYGVPGLKAALTMMGYFGGYPRLPLQPLDDRQMEELATTFKAAGAFKDREAS
jgi:4-hydroxy-2-oxoglutarate aldolase